MKGDDMSDTPNGLLTSEPYVNYVAEIPKNSENERPCTLLNKLLMLFAFLFFIATVLFLGLYLHEQSINKQVEKKYCTTADCVEAAAFMISAMKEDVDPCDNFYQYACGGWLAKNPIPDGKKEVSMSSILTDMNFNTMRGILTNLSAHTSAYNRSDAIHKCIVLYSTCINISAVNRLGVKPLKKLLENIGKFETDTTSDIKTSEKEKKEKLLDLFVKMHDEAHLFPYFAAAIQVDYNNSNRYRLTFTQWKKGLGLDLFHYKKNRTDAAVQMYIDFLTEVGMKLIPDVPRETIQLMANQTFSFEKELAAIFVPLDELTTVEKRYYMTTIKSLQNNSSSINYLKYVQHMFKNTSISIEENEMIFVETLNYFVKLDSVIAKTDIRIIQNYVLFTVASAYLKYLTEDLELLSKNLTIATSGESKEMPRWKKCVMSVDKGMGMALGALFVEKTFTHSSFQEANYLVENVRDTLIGILPNLKWMGNETVAAAQDKAEAIRQKIGYPEFIADRKKLDKFYEGLTLVKGEYFENQRKLLKFDVMTRLKRLRQRVDESVWYITPPTVDAYYLPSGNQIVFPAGILQPPFFKAGYPKSVNFGSLGSIIGHEIIHGFDNNGRYYDPHGNYRGKNHSWWSAASVSGFKKRAKCFIDQYSRFKVAGQKVKGSVTLGENIADNGGLKVSYKAYSNWVKENGEELLLPGIEKSNEEVFFIAFGQLWCTGELNKSLIKLIETDVHSPIVTRVKGSIRNNEDFARVFNCPIGSPMNPQNKCSIW